MKILYIITQADGGGAQKYVLDLAEHFGGAIAAGTEAGALFEEAAKRGIKTFPLKHLKRNISPWHDLLAIWEIKTLINNFQPDITHLNSSKAGFLGSLAGRLARRGGKPKIIFTAHGFFYFKNSPWYVKLPYSILERFASKFRDVIIAVSEEDKQQAIKHHLLPPDKIITVHNGIKEIPFKETSQARAELGLDQGKIIIGNVAQLYNRKAIDMLIEAAAGLPEDVKSRLQFLVLGDGPEREKLTKQINKASLNSIFLLAGYKPQAVTFLKAFDIFVLSSRREGFPYVLLEAMQAGLPIIATDVGGNKEALGDAGIIVKAENPKLLTDAILSLINNPQKQKELLQKALLRSQEFSLQKMLERTGEIYR